MDLRESYDAAAEAYGEHLGRELDGKPLDRHLLNRFAEALAGKGRVADLGCGPGHVAAYLDAQGVDVVGIDLAPEMVRVAKELHPGLEFRVGDMARLDVAPGSLAGVLAFYSIVHCTPANLAPVFHEMRRVLVPGGLAFLVFHAGDEVVHVDDLLGVPVDLDFRYHPPSQVVEGLRAAGLEVIEHTERAPYDDVEYPSRRCYLLARAVAAE